MDTFYSFPDVQQAVLVVVDIQEKMTAVMKKDVLMGVLKNTSILIQAAQELDLPILVTEQYPKGLGRTMEEIIQVLGEYQPIEKLTFSCWREQKFIEALEATGRRQIILCGVETHVCLYQTAVDLLDAEYVPFLIADAVCSREKRNWKFGLEAVRHAGIKVVSTEMLLFQLLKVAGTPQFKKISGLIK